MALKAIVSDTEDEKAQFLYEIPNGLQTDDLVEIRGFTMGSAKSIGLEFSSKENLKDGKLIAEGNRATVPFRLTLRIGGEWDATGCHNGRERHRHGRTMIDFKASSDFCIRIACLADQFQVFLEKSFVLEFDYLVSLRKATHLILSGDAQFRALEFFDSHEFLEDYRSTSDLEGRTSESDAETLVATKPSTDKLREANENWFGRSRTDSQSNSSEPPSVREDAQAQDTLLAATSKPGLSEPSAGEDAQIQDDLLAATNTPNTSEHAQTQDTIIAPSLVDPKPPTDTLKDENESHSNRAYADSKLNPSESALAQNVPQAAIQVDAKSQTASLTGANDNWSAGARAHAKSDLNDPAQTQHTLKAQVHVDTKAPTEKLKATNENWSGDARTHSKSNSGEQLSVREQSQAQDTLLATTSKSNLGTPLSATEDAPIQDNFEVGTLVDTKPSSLKLKESNENLSSSARGNTKSNPSEPVQTPHTIKAAIQVDTKTPSDKLFGTNETWSGGARAETKSNLSVPAQVQDALKPATQMDTTPTDKLKETNETWSDGARAHAQSNLNDPVQPQHTLGLSGANENWSTDARADAKLKLSEPAQQQNVPTAMQVDTKSPTDKLSGASVNWSGDARADAKSNLSEPAQQQHTLGLSGANEKSGGARPDAKSNLNDPAQPQHALGLSGANENWSTDARADAKLKLSEPAQPQNVPTAMQVDTKSPTDKLSGASVNWSGDARADAKSNLSEPAQQQHTLGLSGTSDNWSGGARADAKLKPSEPTLAQNVPQAAIQADTKSPTDKLTGANDNWSAGARAHAKSDLNDPAQTQHTLKAQVHVDTKAPTEKLKATNENWSGDARTHSKSNPGEQPSATEHAPTQDTELDTLSTEEDVVVSQKDEDDFEGVDDVAVRKNKAKVKMHAAKQRKLDSEQDSESIGAEPKVLADDDCGPQANQTDEEKFIIAARMSGTNESMPNRATPNASTQQTYEINASRSTADDLLSALKNEGLLDLQTFDAVVCKKEPGRIATGKVASARAPWQPNATDYVFALSTADEKTWPLCQPTESTILIHLRLLPTASCRAFLIHGSTGSVLCESKPLPPETFLEREVKFSLQRKFNGIAIRVNGHLVVDYKHQISHASSAASYALPCEKMTYLTLAANCDENSLTFDFPDSLLLPYYAQTSLHNYSDTEMQIQFNADDYADRLQFGFTQDNVESPHKSCSALVCDINLKTGNVSIGPEKFGEATQPKANFDAGELRNLRGDHQLAFQVHSKDYQLLLDRQPIVTFEQFVPPSSLKHVFVQDGGVALQAIDYGAHDGSEAMQADDLSTSDLTPLLGAAIVDTDTQKNENEKRLPNGDKSGAKVQQARTKRVQRSNGKSTDPLLSSLHDEGILDLERYAVVKEAKEPGAIRVGRYAYAHARLRPDATECLFAVSTAAQTVWPQCMAGEVTILFHLRLLPLPTFRVFLFNGPVCLALCNETTLAITDLRRQANLTFSLLRKYKTITLLVNNHVVLDYNYKVSFDDVDHKQFFPLSKMNQLTVAGDLEQESLKFDFPQNLMLPYCDVVLQDIMEYCNPEMRMRFKLKEEPNWMRFGFVTDDVETMDDSKCTILCEIDPIGGRVTIGEETRGKPTDSKASFEADGLRNLSGDHLLTFRFSREYQLLLDDKPIATCKQFVEPSDFTNLIIKDGSFELIDIDYYPKKKSLSPCCAGCIIQ